MNEDNYGFVFNDIKINGDTFKKDSKNNLGQVKINNEIAFYLYVLENQISFRMPQLLNHANGSLTIKYIKNASTLTNIIDKDKDNLAHYVGRIKKHLESIHSIKKPTTHKILVGDLTQETYQKVMDRYSEFDWASNELYNLIHTVNNLKIQNIEFYCEKITTRLTSLLKDVDSYNLIHGDTHLGNILLDENDQLYFIDPRGCFGSSKLFGLYEYDYAKLLFGISGYSVFDNMKIDDLCIKDNNITIDFIQNYEYVFTQGLFDEVTRLLCLSIWLANNSCFSNVNKKITSLMIAYYYCEKYMQHL